MTNAEAGLVSTKRWPRTWIMGAIIFAIGAAGLAIKRPFGHYLYQVMGKPISSGPGTLLEWIMSDYFSLFLVLVACFFYERSGLPGAPRIERLLFRDARVGERPRVWRPAIVGALVCVLIFAVSVALGGSNPLTSSINAGAIPREAQTKLAMLYPLAFIGAALSEEVIFRFGVMGTLLGLLSFIGGRNLVKNNVTFWVVNLLQGAWFGFVHVKEGIVASQSAGLGIETLIAPQTWAGVVFGYVFRRWGLEAAIVAHMATDILVPIYLSAWGHFHH